MIARKVQPMGKPALENSSYVMKMSMQHLDYQWDN